MPRAILLVMDSVGIGSAPDAAAYGDLGADTVGHIAEQCARGHADATGLRAGPLSVPTLSALGLGEACRLATGRVPPGLSAPQYIGRYGCAAETSRGKDTPSGHWEIAGVPVRFDWGVFPQAVPAFPRRLIADLCAAAELPGILGDCHASGTEIIKRFGAEHIATGKPICYTSADSVFQIAAHEVHFGLARLYRVCEIARALVDPLNVGRVIARPFVGDGPTTFARTANRHDYTVPPPAPTLLDAATRARRTVISVGKIEDIFAACGTGRKVAAAGNAALLAATVTALDDLPEGGLIVTNLGDFDTLYGHRRDVAGYAAALEAFDRDLPRLLARLAADDVVILTADHGCDPTWPGSDHTREWIPVLAYGPRLQPGEIGRRSSFADIGAAVAAHLDLPPLPCGDGTGILDQTRVYTTRDVGRSTAPHLYL